MYQRDLWHQEEYYSFVLHASHNCEQVRSLKIRKERAIFVLLSGFSLPHGLLGQSACSHQPAHKLQAVVIGQALQPVSFRRVLLAQVPQLDDFSLSKLGLAQPIPGFLFVHRDPRFCFREDTHNSLCL
jgi:hypothetical protein